MDVATVLLLVGGFVVLVAGGESLVRGAGALARTIGLSPLVVGLTVVAFATSAPELAVSAGAAITGSPGLAVGNVVGSNVANVLLILGLSALFLPLIVKSQIVRADIPVMVAMSAVLLLIALDGAISTLDGILLISALVIYVVVTIVVARRNHFDAPSRRAQREPPPVRSRSTLINVGFVILGVALLVGGAQLLVTGATETASAFGVSDLVIGLTVVAVGTSLPELATSVVAAIRGERDMAVGNVVGSNLFNIGFVLGITAVVSPDGIAVASAAVRFDIPIMIAVALVLLPVAFTGQAVARWEGALFLGLFIAYVTYLLLEATDHEALEPFSAAMLWFVVPITVLWLVLLVGYELGLRRARREERRRQP